jgi:hypothetical protein
LIVGGCGWVLLANYLSVLGLGSALGDLRREVSGHSKENAGGAEEDGGHRA